MGFKAGFRKMFWEMQGVGTMVRCRLETYGCLQDSFTWHAENIYIINDEVQCVFKTFDGMLHYATPAVFAWGPDAHAVKQITEIQTIAL